MNREPRPRSVPGCPSPRGHRAMACPGCSHRRRISRWFRPWAPVRAGWWLRGGRPARLADAHTRAPRPQAPWRCGASLGGGQSQPWEPPSPKASSSQDATRVRALSRQLKEVPRGVAEDESDLTRQLPLESRPGGGGGSKLPVPACRARVPASVPPGACCARPELRRPGLVWQVPPASRPRVHTEETGLGSTDDHPSCATRQPLLGDGNTTPGSGRGTQEPWRACSGLHPPPHLPWDPMATAPARCPPWARARVTALRAAHTEGTRLGPRPEDPPQPGGWGGAPEWPSDANLEYGDAFVPPWGS